MNLVDNPWIPCIKADGKNCLASLLDCFTDASLVDLNVRPHERIALMRLLLCISYAAVGIPNDTYEWQDCREELGSKAAKYLEEWKDSFELFHPTRPFLQIADLATTRSHQKRTACSKLDVSLATGNNSILFDHAASTERIFSPEWLALQLVTFQETCPLSIVGFPWIPTASKKASKNEKVTGKDAICSTSSMLHTFIRCETLLDTLYANLLSKDDLSAYSILYDDWEGRPLWEKYPQSPHDKNAIENATRTFLGRMVPLTRAILLSPDGKEMILGDGLPYPVFNDKDQSFSPEVSSTVILKPDKTTRSVVRTQINQAIWRQLPALTSKRDAKHHIGCCLALSRCAEDNDRDIVVCGMAHDKAKVLDIIESVFHLPANMFNENGHKIYEAEVQKAETLEKQLQSAAKAYAKVIHADCKSLLDHTQKTYWTGMETGLSLLWQMLRLLGSEEYLAVKKQWRLHIRQCALNAYDDSCSTATARKMQAYVIGKRIVTHAAYRILEKEEI